jgi:HEAT repeat protein
MRNAKLAVAACLGTCYLILITAGSYLLYLGHLRNSTPQGQDLASWVHVAFYGDFDSRQEAKNVLRHALKNTDPGDRCLAADVLLRVEPTDEDALATVLDLMKNSDPAVRREATSILGLCGRYSVNPDRAFAALVDGLGDSGESVVLEAQLGLMGWTQISEEMVLALVAKLAIGDKQAATTAATALVLVEPHSDRVTPALINVMKKGTASDRLRAVEVLGSIGPSAEQALPDLNDLLAENDQELRSFALKAIAQIKARK